MSRYRPPALPLCHYDTVSVCHDTPDCRAAMGLAQWHCGTVTQLCGCLSGGTANQKQTDRARAQEVG